MQNKKISTIDIIEKIRNLEKQLDPQEPCSIGCFSHQSHPCEKCGRIFGMIPIEKRKIIKKQLDVLNKKLKK
jgi:hypothetical protein